MYKVEYLILLDENKTQCKTVQAFKSLLQSDSDQDINDNKISYKTYTASIQLRLGKKEKTTHLFFNLSLTCDSERDIDKFSMLLKAVRRTFSLLTKNHYVVWDDLTLIYSKKAYPIIFEIENLLRKLITKFMLTNIGVGWTKERVPTDVKQSINPNNNDINFLNNVDFIQLKNFLFSENYPNHKESLIKELKAAKDFSNLKLEEIKSLLPESNWDKFFEPIVGCDAEYLKKRWDKLYELRCKVAHNKSFNKRDLEEVEKLAAELKPYIEKALNIVDEIVIPEEEKENVAENIVINLSESFGEFIHSYRHLERMLYELSNHPKVSGKEKRIRGVINQSDLLFNKGIISDAEFKSIKKILNVRKNIVHQTDGTMTIAEISHAETIIDFLIADLTKYFIEI